MGEKKRQAQNNNKKKHLKLNNYLINKNLLKILMKTIIVKKNTKIIVITVQL